MKLIVGKTYRIKHVKYTNRSIYPCSFECTGEYIEKYNFGNSKTLYRFENCKDELGNTFDGTLLIPIQNILYIQEFPIKIIVKNKK